MNDNKHIRQLDATYGDFQHNRRWLWIAVKAVLAICWELSRISDTLDSLDATLRR